MRDLPSLALALLTVVGCSEPARAPESAAPAPPAPTEEPAPDPDPADEQVVGRIRSGLGADRVAIVESAERVRIGRMGRRCLREGEDPAEGQDYFVRCPLITPLVDLDPSDPATRELASILLDDESYDFDIRIRCNSDYQNVGVRFTRGAEHIDYFLISCQTGFLVRDGDEERTVGAIIDPQHRERLVTSAPPV